MRQEPSEIGMRARVAGKIAVEARTVWSLDVMRLRFRCLRDEQGPGFTVEVRSTKGWSSMGLAGSDAHALLLRVASAKTVVDLFKRTTEGTSR